MKTASGTRTEVRELAEPPALSLNLSRRLANGGLVAGARHHWTIFDPATLHNAPVVVDVGKRELVRGAGAAPIPAFRVETEFAGLRTTSWVTDTGEVVREESPLGLMTVRESPENARAMAVSSRMQTDLLEAAAIVPVTKERIDEPRDVLLLRMRLEGADLSKLEARDSTAVPRRSPATSSSSAIRAACGPRPPIPMRRVTSRRSRSSKATIPRFAPRPRLRCAA